MEPETRSGTATTTPRSTLPAVLGVAALAALLATAYLWQELGAARSAARDRERTVFASVENDRVALRDELAEIAASSQELARRETTLEQEIAALRARSESGRETLTLAEARHLLRLANETLHLAHDPQRAAAALRAADARLAELHDGRIVAVRTQIARELAALSALPHADLPGVALALIALSERVPALPLRTRLPESAAPVPADPAEPLSAWEHFVMRVQGAFRGLITVRRAPGASAPLLAPEQEWFLRRNLELKLETARLAALNRDGAAFVASIRTARDWLAVHFDPASPAVREAVRDLDAMQKLKLAPALPDLSRSLTLLEQRIGADPAH